MSLEDIKNETVDLMRHNSHGTRSACASSLGYLSWRLITRHKLEYRESDIIPSTGA
ncbi:unnamed protein product [Brassica rapa subsp. narinosa]